MASPAEEFRKKAAKADQEAEQATDPKLRDNYRKLVQSWRQMADQFEAFEKHYGSKPKPDTKR